MAKSGNIKKMIKKSILITAKYSARALYYLGSYIIPPNENIILFESSNGRNYTGNPKSIPGVSSRPVKSSKFKESSNFSWYKESLSIVEKFVNAMKAVSPT